MITTRTLLADKALLPSEMRTAEWAMVPQWQRERAFYMAGVTDAEILQGFRNEAALIVQGDSTIEQSRKTIEQMLDAMGYSPEPGQEGTIKDLRSMRRIQTALRTNVVLLQGWAQKARGMTVGALAAFPAWELIRLEERKDKRDWEARFVLAGGTIRGGRMMAMKDSDVWRKLGDREIFADALGVDYAPFAWGSGKGLRQVSRSVAEQYGVIPEGWTPRAVPVDSPNASLQSTPRVTDADLKDALSEKMRGMAEWEDDKFVFTDPNGTRPMPADALVDVWKRGMPDAFAELPGEGLMQREAAERWLTEPEWFEDAADRNGWDDLTRLAMRLESPPVDRLWRGVRADDEILEALMNLSAGDDWRVGDALPLEEWFATAPRGGANVVFEVESPKGAADFEVISQRLVGRPAGWVYRAGARFEVVETIRDAGVVRILLTEVMP